MASESELLRSFFATFHDGVYLVDRNRRITFWNRGAERISGYPADAMVGAHCHDDLLMHVDHTGTRLCQGRCPLAETLVDGQSREADVYLHHRDGHRVPVRVRVSPVVDAAGEITGAIEVFTDNSARMEALDRVQDLERVAYVDPLTGLANRALTAITLQARVDELTRYGWPFGVLFVDVDQFKSVNDRLGHDAGDTVLRAVAATLRNAMRGFDLVGRWGGEEFVVLLANVDAPKLLAVAERLRALVEASVVSAGGAENVVTISVGGTLAVAGETVESIIARADLLMSASKEAGRNRVTIG